MITTPKVCNHTLYAWSFVAAHIHHRFNIYEGNVYELNGTCSKRETCLCSLV